MPIYEYECPEDGTVIELLRPASQADAPVEDPAGRGRRFVRKFSTFASSGTQAGVGTKHVHVGGCCPCGKSAGSCRSGD